MLWGIDQPVPTTSAAPPPSEPVTLTPYGDPFREPVVASDSSGHPADLAARIRQRCWEVLGPVQAKALRPQPQDMRPPWLFGIFGLLVAVLLIWSSLASGDLFNLMELIGMGVLSAMLLMWRGQRSQLTHADQLLDADQRLLEQWAEHYGLCRHRLETTRLPLTIMDDALWERFMEGIAPRVRDLLLGHSHSFTDRLFQATAFWEMLVQYSAGRPDYSTLAVMEFSGRIQTLRNLVAQEGLAQLVPGSIRQTTYNFARFAALYDFFHEGAEVPGEDETAVVPGADGPSATPDWKANRPDTV